MPVRLSLGDSVLVYADDNGKNTASKKVENIQIGVIKYIGLIQGYGMNEYVGIELVESITKGHNGTINGFQYFDSPHGYAIHTRVTNVIRKLEAGEVTFKMQEVIRLFKSQLQEYIQALSQRDEYIKQLQIRQRDLHKIMKEYDINKEALPQSLQLTDLDYSSSFISPHSGTGSILKLLTPKDNDFGLDKKRMTLESNHRFSFESNSYLTDSSYFHEERVRDRINPLKAIHENRRFSNDGTGILPAQSTFSQSTYTDSSHNISTSMTPIRTKKKLKKRRSSLSSLHELKKHLQSMKYDEKYDQDEEWSDNYQLQYYSSDDDTSDANEQQTIKSMHSQFQEYTTNQQKQFQPMPLPVLAPIYSSPLAVSSPVSSPISSPVSLMQSQSSIDFSDYNGAPNTPIPTEKTPTQKSKWHKWKHAVPEIRKTTSKKSAKNKSAKTVKTSSNKKSRKNKKNKKTSKKGKGKWKGKKSRTARRRSSITLTGNPLGDNNINNKYAQADILPSTYRNFQNQKHIHAVNRHHPAQQYSAPVTYDNIQMQQFAVRPNNLKAQSPKHQMQYSAPLEYYNVSANVVNHGNNNVATYYAQPQIEQWVKQQQNTYFHK